MDDFSGVGSGQALVAALSSFVPKNKSHTITPIYNYFTDSTPKFRKMIQHLNHKLLVNKTYQVQEL